MELARTLLFEPAWGEVLVWGAAALAAVLALGALATAVVALLDSDMP